MDIAIMERHREDNFNDIVAKAMKGKSIGKLRLSEMVGCPHPDIQGLVKGRWNEEIAAAICPILDLDFQSLRQIGLDLDSPTEPQVNGVEVLTSSFTMSDGYQMQVNAFVLNVGEEKAVLVDTGVDAALIIDFLKMKSLQLEAIYITHDHLDHTYALDAICAETGCDQVWVDAHEEFTKGQSVRDDQVWTYPAGKMSSVSTAGHSAGGRSWLWEGECGQSIAFVGDAIFYGSVGGMSTQSYEKGLLAIEEGILSLGDHTVLCPGHGILTTVKNEKTANPFFSSKYTSSN